MGERGTIGAGRIVRSARVFRAVGPAAAHPVMSGAWLVALLVLAVVGAATSAPAWARAAASAKMPTSAEAPTQVTLALDWYPNATHAGLYSAVYEGYFAEENLEVEAIAPPPATGLVLLGMERVDFAIEGVSGLLTVRDRGVPVVSVMGIIQGRVGAMMTLADAGIETVADFRGKKIGTDALPEGRARLETVLEAEGVGLDEVEIIDVGWGQTGALLSGSIDVAAGVFRTWQGVEAELEGYDVRFLYWDDYGVPPVTSMVLAANENTIARRPDLVERFVRAMVRGYEFAVAHPEAAAEYVLKADPELRRDLVMRSVALLAPKFKGSAPGVGWHDLDEWKTYIAWMAERGLLSRELPAEETFTNAFLP